LEDGTECDRKEFGPTLVGILFSFSSSSLRSLGVDIADDCADSSIKGTRSPKSGENAPSPPSLEFSLFSRIPSLCGDKDCDCCCSKLLDVSLFGPSKVREVDLLEN